MKSINFKKVSASGRSAISH